MIFVEPRTYTRRCRKCKELFKTKCKFGQICSKCDNRNCGRGKIGRARRKLKDIMEKYGFSKEEYEIMFVELGKHKKFYSNKKATAKDFLERFLDEKD